MQPYGVDHLKNLFMAYDFLDKSQWWSTEELKAYQLAKMKDMLTYAQAHVPYYRSCFERVGFDPRRMTCLDDLRSLPFLTKEIVKSQAERILSDNLSPEEIIWGKTSGTTGVPLNVAIEKRALDVRDAISRRYWSGILGSDSKLVRSVNLCTRGFTEGKWFARTGDFLYLAAFAMTEANLPEYLLMIEEFKPTIITGYPSSLNTLAAYVLRECPELKYSLPLRAIGSSAETVYSDQRQIIEKAFGAPLYDAYGSVEQVAIFLMCGQADTYHQAMEYSYVEILDERGDPVTEPGAMGEIVGTTLENRAMPLIRYRTGDLAAVSGEPCPCGRGLSTVRRIEGRTQDFAVAIDGSIIPMTSLVNTSCFQNIEQFQYAQTEPARLLLRLVLMEAADPQVAIAEVTRCLEERFSGRFTCEPEIVEKIPPGPTGKMCRFVQYLPLDSGRVLEGVKPSRQSNS